MVHQTLPKSIPCVLHSFIPLWIRKCQAYATTWILQITCKPTQRIFSNIIIIIKYHCVSRRGKLQWWKTAIVVEGPQSVHKRILGNVYAQHIQIIVRNEKKVRGLFGQSSVPLSLSSWLKPSHLNLPLQNLVIGPDVNFIVHMSELPTNTHILAKDYINKNGMLSLILWLV